ncbi:GNAT family N-acetyltransferase [Leptospira sp. WS92.C1]
MQKEFTFHKNFRNQPRLRENFFQFTPKALYGADFRLWYELGFWRDFYIPYSLFDKNEMISNVSVCEMRILLNGEKFNAVQLATVGTLPKFRNRGLSRRLMNQVLQDYDKHSAFFFLFGNEDVLDFYPKWGFRKVEEFCFVWKKPSQFFSTRASLVYRALNWFQKSNRDLFDRYATMSLPVTNRFGVVNYGPILAFYGLYAYPNDFYHFPELDAIIVF